MAVKRTTPPRVNGKFVKASGDESGPSTDARTVLGDDSKDAAGEGSPSPSTAPVIAQDSQGSDAAPAVPAGDDGPKAGAARARIRKPSGKRRGRPRKDSTDTHAGASDAPPPRARKATGGGASAGYASVLYVAHAAAAGLTRCPELQLSGQEAEVLGKALDAVAQEFGVVVSSKTQAVIGLVSAMALIYPQRFAAIASRRKTERKAAADARKPPGPPPEASQHAAPPPGPADVARAMEVGAAMVVTAAGPVDFRGVQ